MNVEGVGQMYQEQSSPRIHASCPECAPRVCLLLLLALILILVSYPPHRTRRRQWRGRASARRSMTGRIPLPSSFSWANVSDSDAEEWTKAFGRPLLPGRYASPVFDQHSQGWCGACYLVSSLQMLQDRCNILLGQVTPAERALETKAPPSPPPPEDADGGSGEIESTPSPPPRRMLPFVRFDAQLLFSSFEEHASGVVGWSGCHGGDPLKVLSCVGTGGCPLSLLPHTETEWRGFSTGGGDEGNERPVPESPFSVTTYARLSRCDIDSIREEVWKHGPVVLACASAPLLHCDERGVATGADPSLVPDHAAAVVGWVTRSEDGAAEPRRYWIVRNSWGEERAPSSRPGNVRSCARRQENTCDPSFVPWRGTPDLPGHVLLPFEGVLYDGSGGDRGTPVYAATVAHAR